MKPQDDTASRFHKTHRKVAWIVTMLMYPGMVAMCMVGMVTSVQEEEWLSFTCAMLIFLLFGIGFPAAVCWFFVTYGYQIKTACHDWSYKKTPYSMFYDGDSEEPAWYFHDWRTGASSYIMPPGFQCKQHSLGAWPDRTWVQHQGLFAPGPFGAYHLHSYEAQAYFCFKIIIIGLINTMIFADLNSNHQVGATVLAIVAIIRTIDATFFCYSFPLKDEGPSLANCANWGMAFSLIFIAVAAIVQAADSTGAHAQQIATWMILALLAPLALSLVDGSGLILMAGYAPKPWQAPDDDDDDDHDVKPIGLEATDGMEIEMDQYARNESPLHELELDQYTHNDNSSLISYLPIPRLSSPC